MTRQELADLWREAAQITRVDVFGPEDALRPTYLDGNNVLATQIDIPAVGMVGPRYDGGLAILSVNGAGGNDHAKALPSSNVMYAAFRKLRDAQPGAAALAAFEALNKAFMASMPDWGMTKHRTNQVLDAAHLSLDDIAYLYLVPFRIRGDGGRGMDRKYLDAGYRRHLVRQLRVVAPQVIIAMDRPSEQAALQYQQEAPAIEVIYFTGQRNAHGKRKETLAVIASRCT